MKATTAKKWKWLSVSPLVRCTSTALQVTSVTTPARVRTRREKSGRVATVAPKASGAMSTITCSGG